MKRYALISGDRVTTVVEQDSLPTIPGQWVECGNAGPGDLYDGLLFTKAVSPPDPCQYFIDVGPFFDRFGAAKYTILASSDATVQALIKDLQIRKWIDLQNVQVAQGLDILISKTLITTTDKTNILNTPISSDENMALRKLYF